jgi:hypothetical protein
MKNVQKNIKENAIQIAAVIQPAAIVVAPVFPWYFEPGGSYRT